MPLSCQICRAVSATNKVSLFSVPKDEGRRRRWVEFCGIAFEEKACIYQKHFDPEDFYNGPPGNKKCRLMPGALPRRNLFPSYIPTNIEALDKTNIIEPLKEVGNIPIKLSQCRETELREVKRQLQAPYL